MRGKLIAFEGIEGCGKTTQLQRLNQWLTQRLASKLSDISIMATREPGATPLGRALRHLLLASDGQPQLTIAPMTELLLYIADRAQHVTMQLQPELEAGTLILCDRYTDSTLAYQGFGRGLDHNVIDYLNNIATMGVQSDLTLWLDLDVEQSLRRTDQRGELDRIEQSDVMFHRRVQQGFATLAAEYPERIVRIEASESEDKVAQAIQAVLEQRLETWQMS